MCRQRNTKPSGLQTGSRHFSCLFPLHAPAAFSLPLPLLVCDTWLPERCRMPHSHFTQGLIWGTIPQSSPFTHTRWWSISSRAVLQRGKVWDTHQATSRGVQSLPRTSQSPHHGEVVVICLSYASKFAWLYKPKSGDSQTCLDRWNCSANTLVFVTSSLSRRAS